MHEVGAVEPLTFHHERLLPEQLLARNDLHRHAEHLRLDGVLEPAIVYRTDAVARAEDKVDEVVVLPRLAQPVWEGQLGAVAGLAERRHRAIHVASAQEEIEVLRVTHDPRVLEEGVRASDEKGNACITEHVQRAAIERVRVARRFVERGLAGSHGVMAG